MEDVYQLVYRIHYNYGLHDLNLEVPSYEFERVIDSLSSEFEISIDEDIWDSTDFPGYECIQAYYFINDYCGNKYKVGDTFERKLK